MKEKLIEELKKFKVALTAIDARYETIKEQRFEHKKHIDTLREIETIMVDIRNRVDRFYTKEFQYNKTLNDLSQYLNALKMFYGEIPPGGLSMEDSKLRLISVLDGIINELEQYDLPSSADPKFDKK